MNERGRVVGRRERERERDGGRDWEVNERGRVVGRRTADTDRSADGHRSWVHDNRKPQLQNWHIIRNTNIHEHNTRRQSNLHIYRTQHTFARHCLRHDLPNTLNNTCELVKGKIYTHSLSGFTNYAKHQIIQNYELTCNITRCYICSHDVR